jgi:hypothetical protein
MQLHVPRSGVPLRVQKKARLHWGRNRAAFSESGTGSRPLLLNSVYTSAIYLAGVNRHGGRYSHGNANAPPERGVHITLELRIEGEDFPVTNINHFQPSRTAFINGYGRSRER